MKTIGIIVAMDDASGIGDVEIEGRGERTVILAEDCRRAGIDPRVGTRLAYRTGAHPRAGTGAVDLEKIG